MIHDAKVEVTCDYAGCQEYIEVDPPYVYMTKSGAGGHYDTEDETIEALIRKAGWKVPGTHHYCEEHGGEIDSEAEED